MGYHNVIGCTEVDAARREAMTDKHKTRIPEAHGGLLGSKARVAAAGPQGEPRSSARRLDRDGIVLVRTEHTNKIGS
jgi:hypothetical protein